MIQLFMLVIRLILRVFHVERFRFYSINFYFFFFNKFHRRH